MEHALYSERVVVNLRDLFRVWGCVLAGRRPFLSIEITRECPLRCPGCYAYSDDHVANGVNLRQLSDKKNDELVRGVLDLVDLNRPLHLSIVGGDPLVRFRELKVLLPELEKRRVHVQLVTSAFREIPEAWSRIRRLSIVVSIDGLQPEHDARRKPATYDRILHNIRGHQVTVHCTVTGQMMQRPGYLREFLEFWSPKQEIKRVWMSFFTPQRGATAQELLTAEQRSQAVRELMTLRESWPKLEMSRPMLREFLSPPASPRECIFAQTTETISADLKSRITPCQFGGDPDCSQCGCIASMGLAAVGKKQVLPGLKAADILTASMKTGNAFRRLVPPTARPTQVNALTQITMDRNVAQTRKRIKAESGD